MLSNRNHVELEGYVVLAPEVMETEGKKVMNFVIENCHFSRMGEDRHMYNCVIWNTNVDKYAEKLKPGVFIRIDGHLQENTYMLPEEKHFKYSKVCCDHIEFDE